MREILRTPSKSALRGLLSGSVRPLKSTAVGIFALDDAPGSCPSPSILPKQLRGCRRLGKSPSSERLNQCEVRHGLLANVARLRAPRITNRRYRSRTTNFREQGGAGSIQPRGSLRLWRKVPKSEQKAVQWYQRSNWKLKTRTYVQRLALMSTRIAEPSRSSEDSVCEQRHNFFKYSNVRRY